MPLVEVDKKKYNVLDHEFIKVPNEEYCNLNILESVGIFERLISLIKEITSFHSKHDDQNIIFTGISHGGYIPIQIKENIINPIYVYESDEQQLQNLYINSDKYLTPNQRFYINTLLDQRGETFLIINLFENSSMVEKFITEGTKTPIIISKIHIFIPNTTIYNISNSEFFIIVPNPHKEAFENHFKYEIQGNTLTYDNLVHYTMIVKNAGNDLEDVLIQNMKHFDRWTILDTGSTDNTIDIINKVLVGKKRGQLFQEPFINFRDSRNRCLDLAGDVCKFSIMLDDTYIIKGDFRHFLNTVRGDQFSDSFSMYIQSDDTEYVSNRVLKTNRKLRYLYKIHEVIQFKNNVNVIIPIQKSLLFDFRSDYMENRTMTRKEYDLKLLFEENEEDPETPRHLYYIAQTYNLLEKYELAFQYFIKRVEHKNQGFLQEKVDACFEAARIANFKLNKPWNECEKIYMKCYDLEPSRPEALYFIGIHYYLEGNQEKSFDFFKKAFEIGYPIHKQYSLKPTLSFYFLPKFLV